MNFALFLQIKKSVARAIFPRTFQEILFKNFYLAFGYLETIFDTFKAGETEAIVKPSGDRLFASRFETYARDPEGLHGVPIETVLG